MSALLAVRDLSVTYPNSSRRAVDGVSFSVPVGQTLGLVGESGSGKSTIGKAILGLVRPTGGHITLNGADITQARGRQRRDLARQVQVVFQDPYGSLNPSLTVGRTLAEPLRLRGSARGEAAARVASILAQVGMPADAATRYPGQFSGGQRQRIAIARALVLRPRLLICDEPTSALDLSVQAQILNLLLELRDTLGLAYLFVSHDIDVIRHMSHQVAVLRHGAIVEQGPTSEVLQTPCHEYTRSLLASVPGSGSLPGCDR